MLSYFFIIALEIRQLYPRVVWTGSFFHFIGCKRAKGRGAEEGAGLCIRGRQCFHGPLRDFGGTVVTRLCLLGLLSLFVTSFLMRSWEMMYQCVDLTCFSETFCNRSLTFMRCYFKNILFYLFIFFNFILFLNFT